MRNLLGLDTVGFSSGLIANTIFSNAGLSSDLSDNGYFDLSASTGINISLTVKCVFSFIGQQPNEFMERLSTELVDRSLVGC